MNSIPLANEGPVERTTTPGNPATACRALVRNSDDRILASYEYEVPKNGIKGKAELWKVVGEGEESRLVLETASIDGSSIRPLSDASMASQPIKHRLSQVAIPVGGVSVNGLAIRTPARN